MNSKIDNEFYNQENFVDFRGIVKSILQYWKIMFLTSALFGLLSIPFSLSLTEYYRATIIMAPAQDPNSDALSALKGQLGGLSSFIGNIPSSSGELDIYTSLAILRSRTFTEKFIETKNILPILFSEKWDSENNKWKGSPPTQVAADMLFKKIRFYNYDNQENLITFSIEWKEAEIAKEWTNAYIDLLNDYIRLQAIEEANNSIKFLEEKLEQTSVVSFQTILHGMIEQQTQTVMLADSRKDYAFKIIDAAIVPDERERPNRTLILIIATFAGFSLSLFYAVFNIYAVPFIKDVLEIDHSQPIFNKELILSFIKKSLVKSS